jgi:hypothetical protein
MNLWISIIYSWVYGQARERERPGGHHPSKALKFTRMLTCFAEWDTLHHPCNTQWVEIISYPLLICTWFPKNQFWKNQVWRTRCLVYFKLDFYCLRSLQKINFKIDLCSLKIQFVELDFSNLIFQKSSTDQQGVRVPILLKGMCYSHYRNGAPVIFTS